MSSCKGVGATDLRWLRMLMLMPDVDADADAGACVAMQRQWASRLSIHGACTLCVAFHIIGRSRKKNDLHLLVISFSSLSRLFSYNRIESKTLEKEMFGCN